MCAEGGRQSARASTQRSYCAGRVMSAQPADVVRPYRPGSALYLGQSRFNSTIDSRRRAVIGSAACLSVSTAVKVVPTADHNTAVGVTVGIIEAIAVAVRIIAVPIGIIIAVIVMV